MKKIKICSMFLFSLVTLSGCDNSITSSDVENVEENTDISNAFIISNINDVFKMQENEKTYKLYADHTDSYYFKSDREFAVLNGKNEVLSDYSCESVVELNKGDIIYLKVKGNENENIKINVNYMFNPIKLPYDINMKKQEIDTSFSDESGLLKAAEINYIKRNGGTYVYSNNPELFVDADVNTCLMENKDLTGEVYMAFEHANYSNFSSVYLGYKLINTSNEDVYVTVENVGFQAGGTWFGQLAWYDFYNTKFDLPSDYLVNGVISSKYSSYDYGYQDYTPRIYTPTTYKIPAGQSFYVIGGTTKDSYNNINVDNSANKSLGRMKCSNGQVKFKVTNGKVTGKMFVYSDPNKINDQMEEVGYVTLRNGSDYGRQYQGIAHHQGVIDCDIMWEFNDKTKSQALPVTYKNKVALQTSNKKPYEEFNNKEGIRNNTYWMTHLNPQNDVRAVGMDMVEFICNTTDKKEVVIDNYHADGSGEAANTANWMIEYQDNFTFVNKGNKTRTIKIKLQDNGTLATLIRDNTGKVLQTYYSVGLATKAYKVYEFEVAPLSELQVVVDYLLVACSYGNVMHEVELI